MLAVLAVLHHQQIAKDVNLVIIYPVVAVYLVQLLVKLVLLRQLNANPVFLP